MTIDTLPASASDRGDGRLRDFLVAHWPLLGALLLLAIPTFIRIGQQTWSTEAGAHGPIVLVTGLWLLSYNRIAIGDDAGRAGLGWIVSAVFAWVIYVFGRAFDFISLEALGLYIVALCAAYLIVGGREMRRNLFPFFYLGFVVPPPGWVIDRLTAPLQTFVSFTSVHLLQALDYPIIRQGVALVIAQYQLLVEDACAGMNSLTGLIAISLFYIYLMHRASWRYALVLIALIVPVAIFVNIIRVLALILITYYQGDAAAQGFLHVTTGLVLFMLAVASIFVLDTLLQRIVGARQRRAAA